MVVQKSKFSEKCHVFLGFNTEQETLNKRTRSNGDREGDTPEAMRYTRSEWVPEPAEREEE